MSNCGGCQGLGSHGVLCPKHPDWHPLKIYARMADNIGAGIGDPALANYFWQGAGKIKTYMKEHPWKKSTPTD